LHTRRMTLNYIGPQHVARSSPPFSPDVHACFLVWVNVFLAWPSRSTIPPSSLFFCHVVSQKLEKFVCVCFFNLNSHSFLKFTFLLRPDRLAKTLLHPHPQNCNSISLEFNKDNTLSSLFCIQLNLSL
jgi:hypothetical protein